MMHWLLAAAVLLALVAEPAMAQTTFVPGTATCSGDFAISVVGSNITLTQTNAGDGPVNCSATVGKSSSKFYYTYGTSSPGWTNSVGVSGVGLPLNGYTSGGGEALGDGPHGAGYILNKDGGAFNVARYHGSPDSITGTIIYTLGATMGIAVDLEDLPHQVWWTPDITGTGGCGGGPVWNGSTTSAPVARSGCGGPGTGLFISVGMAPVWPAITGQNYSGQQTVGTFNFADNATLDGLLPGYQAWNASGGGPIDRGVTDQIANAPGWTPNHAVVAGDRVLAGPGWSGGSYVPGSALYLWAVSGSGGTTASSGNGPQVCPSPAGYGGGFDGVTPSQWSGHTTVNDNGITWVCLTQVDYHTIHDMNTDAPPWQAGFTYDYWQWASANGHSFKNLTGHANTPTAVCTSGSTPPVPGGSSDGNCTWEDEGAVSYSSHNNYSLHLTEPVTNQQTHQFLVSGTQNYIEWYGGLEKQAYAWGAGGEDTPITISNHTNTNEAGEPTNVCYDRVTDALLSIYGCGYAPNFIMQPAPGDSWVETYNQIGGPITSPDPTKGVIFTSTQSSADGNEALAVTEFGMNLYRFQIYSTNSIGASGAAVGGMGAGTCWGCNYYSINVKAGGNAAISRGQGGVYNSIVQWTGTSAFGTPLYSRLWGDAVNNTVICTAGGSAPQSIGLTWQKVLYDSQPASIIQNNWVSGCASPMFEIPAYGPAVSSNNATDTPSSFVQQDNVDDPFTTLYGPGSLVQLVGSGSSICGGPCQGLDPINQFVSTSTPDFTLKSGAGLIGAGGAGSAVPSTDAIGNARPTSGRYDIGALQFSGSPPPLSITAVNLSANTFVAGTPSTVGSLTTVLSTGSFSGTDTLVSSGGSCSGGDITHFAISGASPTYALTTTGPTAGSYTICVSSDQPGASNTPFIQPFSITGSSTSTMTGGALRLLRH